MNGIGEVARRYHDTTKHSEISLRASGHYLDWSNRPAPFKSYRSLPAIELPRTFSHPTSNTLEAIREQSTSEQVPSLTLETLAEILFFSAGLTRRMRFGSEQHYMRAASATGALYPIELYVVTNKVKQLGPGVYHFNPLDFSLVKLRDGSHNNEILNATGRSFESRSLTIAFTSLAWRNAWKYEERSYRHWFWDAGVIIANLLATCSSQGFPIRLVTGFVDHDIDLLLGLRSNKEATVALAEVGQTDKSNEESLKRELQELDLEDEASKGEVDYPIIWETNRSSQLHNQAEVDTWTRRLKLVTAKTGSSFPKFPLRPSVYSAASLSDTILRRGSSRKFAQRSISYEALSTIIDSSTGPIPIDFLPSDHSLIDLYVIANDVDSLPTGAYYFDPDERMLVQLREGRMRYFSGYLSLEQLLFSDASAVFFLMTDLAQVLTSLGDRGYRAAQLEAGIRAGKIYLSSYALAVGASGSTFYDDAVTEFFSPHGKDKSPMMEVGVGVPAYKARSGRILPQFDNLKTRQE